MNFAWLWSSALKDRPPPIIRQGPSNQTQAVGGMALFRCQASGDPEPSVTWRKNGVSLLGKDTRFSLLEHGSLQIQNTKVGDQHVRMITPPWLSGLIVLHGSITTFNLLTSEVNKKKAINSIWRYWPSEKSNSAIKTVTSSSIFISDLDRNHTHQTTQTHDTKEPASLWDVLRGFSFHIMTVQSCVFFIIYLLIIGSWFKWYGRSVHVV